MIGRLHLVLDADARNDEFLRRATERALDGGVDVVHLRGPRASGRRLYQLGLSLREIVRAPAMLLVNDRVDIALAVHADGAQLGGRSLPIEAARGLVSGGHLGVSVHGVEEACEAALHGADWLVVGTIFATASHPGRQGGGYDLIAATRSRVDAPLIAIGGIDSSNAEHVIASGADGVAVIRAILDSDAPERAARELRSSLERGLARRSAM